MFIHIEVGPKPLDSGGLRTLLTDCLEGPGQTGRAGAVCTFEGLVRDHGDARDVHALELEHYPGMTERFLRDLAESAGARWSLSAVVIAHRTGRILLDEVVVHTAVASAHRAQAFEACAFLMDSLKTEAPFWKKEVLKDASVWVDARESDQDAAKRW